MLVPNILFLTAVSHGLNYTIGYPKKSSFNSMLLDPRWTGSITSSRLPLCPEMFFGRFLLNQIKRAQVMPMEKN